MPIIRLVILVVITVVLALVGYHFWGLYGAVVGTGIGVGVIVLGGRV